MTQHQVHNGAQTQTRNNLRIATTDSGPTMERKTIPSVQPLYTSNVYVAIEDVRRWT